MKTTKPAQLGTDEAFWQFMTISGKSLLKLFGLSDQEAASYHFQATILKEKKLQPDVQGISSLASSQGRFFMEFQGYEDPSSATGLLRKRFGDVLLNNTKDRYEFVLSIPTPNINKWHCRWNCQPTKKSAG